VATPFPEAEIALDEALAPPEAGALQFRSSWVLEKRLVGA